MINILSFDIEEHFQVSGLADAVSRSEWERMPSRVEKNTRTILELLKRYEVKATFFILGWIAHRHPELIELIARDDHEIASHGYDHKLVYDMTPEQFHEGLAKTNEILKSLSGQQILGHRAPSFSIGIHDLEKFDVLSRLGFKYDSSIFPIKHFRYGEAQSAPLAPFDVKKDGQTLLKEFPMTVVEYFGKRIPAAGGGYFRLYPNFIIRRNFRKAMKDGRPVITYLHPWEFDPEQPRIRGGSFGNTFRHYVNLHKTRKKLEMILSRYEFGPFRDAIKK